MDKKFLILFLLAATACVTEMEYKPISSGNQIIMNSLMSVGDEQHVVFLALSTPGSVEKITGGAGVECYINGDLVVTATEYNVNLWPGTLNCMRAFAFEAEFKAGDEVEIVAEAGGHKISSTVVVPSQAVLGKVDTLTVNDDDESYLSFSVNMSDKGPNEDYYEINIKHKAEIELYKEGVLIGTQNYLDYCWIDCSDDIILSEGNIASDDFTETFTWGSQNYYGAFADRQFNGKDVVLKPKVNKTDFEIVINYSINGEKADSIYIKPSAIVTVSHIQGRHYYYLKALNEIMSGSFADLSLEQISIPDNVKGGIGFVGIGNPASVEIKLPSGEIKIEDDGN